jgi:hypothetical protein
VRVPWISIRIVRPSLWRARETKRSLGGPVALQHRLDEVGLHELADVAADHLFGCVAGDRGERGVGVAEDLVLQHIDPGQRLLDDRLVRDVGNSAADVFGHSGRLKALVQPGSSRGNT